ncbi:carbohydrate-binding protein CenC [Chthoniobacter flavus]|nr:carbohydrate-binding protein CenC [Chthoniobacter flavus]
MARTPNSQGLVFRAARFFGAILFLGFSGLAADTPNNLISNGGFEAGMQIWRGDGKIVLLPDGNRVCEIEASKSRMKDLKQEFHLRQLQQVEVVFRARAINYTGPGLRISMHQHGGGSIIWNRDLPADGSWRSYRILYTRATATNDLRELNIATLLGSGSVQIDDVEVREPSKIAGDEPTPPTVAPTATPAPQATPLPPAVAKQLPLPPIQPTQPKPVNQPPQPSLPPGTFGSLEQVMNSAPAEALEKVKDEATRQEGAAELADYFSKNVKGKPARFRVKIDEARPEISKPKEFLVHVSDIPATTWNGARIAVWMWVRFTEENPTAAEKLSVGSERTISGVITRCLIAKGGRPRIDIDVGQAKVE